MSPCYRPGPALWSRVFARSTAEPTTTITSSLDSVATLDLLDRITASSQIAMILARGRSAASRSTDDLLFGLPGVGRGGVRRGVERVKVRRHPRVHVENNAKGPRPLSLRDQPGGWVIAMICLYGDNSEGRTSTAASASPLRSASLSQIRARNHLAVRCMPETLDSSPWHPRFN